MQELAPEEWKRVLELLDTALDLPPQQRDTWLAALDESRASLKPALIELLKRHDAKETDDFLKALPQFTRVEFDTDADTSELRPEAHIGAYRLIRELGRGGMSVVWLAERVDGKFKRQVALKFPYAGPAQRELAERLARERDILAGLEHPNIARLYDADVTPSGQPFLVLEYVDGIPIRQYCEEKQLSLRERLVLFLQVFKAVQFAHAHLVIHRDLKPSNIHVTADGVVHLLDFGIAKLISQSPASDSPLTQYGGRALTPDYASPEQIAARALTTASDIYSLGVVLYELLAGARPYRLKRDSQASLEEAIAEADVVAPSRATADATVAHELRGDLDTIVLKALEKEPGTRYATAEEMAEDVRRYLDGRPVRARPATLPYRAGKFIRRYRWPVAASGIVAVTLIAALVLTLNAMLEARRERDLAASRLADVRHLANVFLFDVEQKIRDIAGTTEVRHLLVKTGLGYLDRMAADAGDDVTLLREIASGYDKLGDVQGATRISNLGQTEAAIASYLKASALRKHPAIVHSADPMVLREASNGEQRLGTMFYTLGKFKESREHFALSLDFLTRAVSAAPPGILEKLQREEAEAKVDLGYAIAVDGDFSGGVKVLREAVAYFESLPPAKLDEQVFTDGYAWAMSQLIEVLGELPDKQGLTEALELVPRIVVLDRKMLAADPNRADLRRYLVRDLSAQADLLFRSGRYQEAAAPFAESRRLAEHQVAADPSDKHPRRSLARLQTLEARNLLMLGRTNEARALIEPAVDTMSELLRLDPRNATIQMVFVYAATTYEEVIAAQARKRPGSVDPQLRRALSLLDQADEVIKPLLPQLVGVDAEFAGRIDPGRQECKDLLTKT
jgi:serine/threonine protein kinase/tetratricopeptide (TPR) repeat protein